MSFVYRMTIRRTKMGKQHRAGFHSGFALIVVLFILLIIVGAIYYDGDSGYGYC